MVDGRRGRFPKNEIISLLDVSRRFNLAESTTQDFRFDELVQLIGYDELKDIRLGYGSSQGAPLLRKAVGELCGVSPEHVVGTQGTALALYLLAVELCRPGDEVVLFTPCFPPSSGALAGSGVTIRQMPLVFEQGYRIEVARLRDVLSPATRLVSLASPQNPSGVVTSPETVDDILKVMGEVAPEAFLFVDETYREATYGAAPSPASVAGRHPMVISGGSVSKAYGAAGLRVGWMTVQDAGLRERLITAKMNIVISGSPLDETLAAHLLARRQQALEPRRKMLAEALAIVARWRDAESACVEWVRPDGGALCCMRLRPSVFDAGAVSRFWESLPELDVQLAAGTWFGEDQSTFRLGFGYLTLESLSGALAALSEALRRALRAA